MLKTAAKAGIPIISVTTSDTMNAQAVLSNLVGSVVSEWPQGGVSGQNKIRLNSTNCFYTKDPALELSEATYSWLVNHGKVLFLVNHEGTEYAFDGGELPTPTPLVQTFLSSIMSMEEAESCLPALQGLTLKSVSELVRITSVGGLITNHTLLANRWMVSSQVRGLEEVNKDLGVYLPSVELTEYVDLNLPYFNKEIPHQLRPRGVLLHGVPGVGKTLGAKYLAHRFDCPLYRLDLSASLGRYVGESEQAMNRVLTAIKSGGACTLLIDEVEKLFGESDDSGVTYRLLAQLLWFLQEHRELIITVMTTNNIEKLPLELYRQGRIDRIIKLEPLSKVTANLLCKQILTSLGLEQHYDEEISKKHMSSIKELTPSNVTAYTYWYIKENKLLTN